MKKIMPEAGAFSRTEMLIGTAAVARLADSHVMVFGLGGVGGFAVEALVRAGIGELTIVDHDFICCSNLNRQLHATLRSIGRPKVDVVQERVLDINPQAKVTAVQKFYLPENAEDFFKARCDYIIDAIDTVTAKVDLVVRAQAKDIRIISCMGAGNKMDPTRFEIADIFKTSVCPLAKVMRYELRARGIKELKVVYSKENPLEPRDNPEPACGTGRQRVSGSISFVPSVAGLILAGEVVRELIGVRGHG